MGARMHELATIAEVHPTLWEAYWDGNKIGEYPLKWFAEEALKNASHNFRKWGLVPHDLTPFVKKPHDSENAQKSAQQTRPAKMCQVPT